MANALAAGWQATEVCLVLSHLGFSVQSKESEGSSEARPRHFLGKEMGQKITKIRPL